MTRFKRRALLGSALLILIVSGFGYVYIFSTRAALERAEAFQFRRMLVNQLEGQNAYRFFYVSNRRSAPARIVKAS